MADAKLTALTAASALAAADLFYVSQSAASRKATGTQLLALVGTTYVPRAGGTMTGALTIASGTLTASAPALSITQTWNNAAVTFNAIDLNVTNSASVYGGTLQTWRVGGVIKASVSDYGRIQGIEFFVDNTAVIGPVALTLDGASGPYVGFGFASTTDRGIGVRNVAFCNPAGGAWTNLIGEGAATLAQRNGTTQQIFRLYNTADAGLANYERLTLTGVAGTSVNITAETMGTGGDNIDIVLTPAGTGSVKIPVAGLALSGGNANFLLGTTGTSRLTFAGTLSVINKSASADLYFGESTDTGAYFFRGTGGVNVTGAFQVTEMTAPAAPATNSVRIYAEDNGAGKTRLMALFATGSAVQLGIEP